MFYLHQTLPLELETYKQKQTTWVACTCKFMSNDAFIFTGRIVHVKTYLPLTLDFVRHCMNTATDEQTQTRSSRWEMHEDLISRPRRALCRIQKSWNSWVKILLPWRVDWLSDQTMCESDKDCLLRKGNMLHWGRHLLDLSHLDCNFSPTFIGCIL